MKKLILWCLGAAIVCTPNLKAQNILGEALGRLGTAIENRNEKKHQEEYNKQRTSYGPANWDTEYNGVCYKTFSNNVAIVVRPRQESTTTSYSDMEARVRPTTETINPHISLQSINIPDQIYSDKWGICNVKELSGSAFSGSAATQAWITGNIKAIPSHLFRESAIKYVTLNEGTQSIGNDAFHDCYDLKIINFPSTINHIDDRAFMNCTSLNQKIHLPDNIKTLGEYCFAGCGNIEQLRLPENLDHINNGLVAGCASMRNFNIPPGCISMGDYIFCQPQGEVPGLTETTAPIWTIRSYAPFPPTCTSNTFYGLDFNSIMLFVPSHLIDAYRQSPYWSNFSVILALEDLQENHPYSFLLYY